MSQPALCGVIKNQGASQHVGTFERKKYSSTDSSQTSDTRRMVPRLMTRVYSCHRAGDTSTVGGDTED